MSSSGQIDPRAASRGANIHLTVLLSDVLLLGLALFLAVWIDLEGWPADSAGQANAASAAQVTRVAGRQLSQTLALAAVVCAALTLIGWLASKRAVKATAIVAIQSLLVFAVLCVAGSAAGSIHHKQQAAVSSQLRQQRPTPSPYVVTYCTGGRCWGANDGG